MPIDGEDQLGYRVDPDAYYLPDLGLEADEQAALNLAVAGVHLGEPIGRDALLEAGRGRRVTASGVAACAPGRPALGRTASRPCPVLFDAVRQRAAVSFSYRGERRHVDAAGLRFRRGHWYLVGFDRDRGEARTFRVDRIDGAPELGPAGSAAAPEGFDVDAAFGRDPWQFGAGEAVEVDVLVDAAESRPGGRRAGRGGRGRADATTARWSSAWR